MTTRDNPAPAEKAAAKQRGKPFPPGTSGNPAGKPKGCRHRATMAAEALLDGEAETLTRKAIELATAGDVTALRLCLERLIPARKDRPVTFTLPPIASAADAAVAMSAVVAAVAAGDISPTEANEVARLLETYVKTLETSELEARIAALEERHE